MIPVIRLADLKYCEVSIKVPAGHVECAPFPGDSYVLNETWNVDPTNPAVCWRPKTPQELDQEDDDKAAAIVQDFQRSPALKVLVNALMNGDFVPGTQYTPAQLKAIAKANK